MGELAQDMILGLSCSLCGYYFEAENGFPVLCTDCWENATPEGRNGFSKTQTKEL